jgi:hypothetical protein
LTLKKEAVAVTKPGTFLHANMEKDFHMLLEGTIAELIVKLEQNYTGFTFGKTNRTIPCCK